MGIALYKLLGPLIRQDCAKQELGYAPAVLLLLCAEIRRATQPPLGAVDQRGPAFPKGGCIADPAWQRCMQSDGTSFCTPGASGDAPGSAATAFKPTLI